MIDNETKDSHLHPLFTVIIPVDVGVYRKLFGSAAGKHAN